MAILNKDQILAADDLPRENVNVDEWGGEVVVRALTASEEKEIFSKSKAGDEMGAQVYIVAKCIIDDDGKPLFSKSDVNRLAGKNGAVVRRLAQAALRLSGMEVDEAKN